MPEPRTEAYSITALSKLFNLFDGYYDLDRIGLARFLEGMNLLEQENREGLETFAKYAKWSFAISFLEMLNAWQWFLAGIILSRQAYLPAQTMQMYYYSIFFSYRSFLLDSGENK
jgi:hypothetical protein